LAAAGGTIFGGVVYFATPVLERHFGETGEPGFRFVGRYLGDKGSHLELCEGGTYRLSRSEGRTLVEAGAWSESGGRLRLRTESGAEQEFHLQERYGEQLVGAGETFVDLESLNVFDCFGY